MLDEIKLKRIVDGEVAPTDVLELFDCTVMSKNMKVILGDVKVTIVYHTEGFWSLKLNPSLLGEFTAMYYKKPECSIAFNYKTRFSFRFEDFIISNMNGPS